jgi:hypothetical protein
MAGGGLRPAKTGARGRALTEEGEARHEAGAGRRMAAERYLGPLVGFGDR